MNREINMADCTVIIPCHNQGRFLRDCLASVLAQTTPPREIIIIDDGSTCPETKNVLASAETTSVAKVLRNEQARGLPAARNQGIAIATTTYVLPLDADDKIAPGYIEKATRVLAENPRAGIVSGDSVFFGRRSGKAPFPEFSKWRMTVDNCIPAASVFRKSDWERADGYCEDFKEGFEDWDFHLALLEAGLEYHHLNETVHYYRRHEDNMTDRLDLSPHAKEDAFALLVKRHPEFFAQHAQEAMPFLYEERAKQRAFGKRPLVALCRKALRTNDFWRDSSFAKWLNGHSLAVLTLLTVLVIGFQIYVSVIQGNSVPTGTVFNIEMIRDSGNQLPTDESMIIFGLTSDGRRLPLGLVNISQSGTMPITIRPTGKSCEAARGSEIWLLSSQNGRMGAFPRGEGESAGWHFNTDVWHQPALVAYGDESPLKFSVQDETSPIFLMRHQWSGRCEIVVGETKAEFDLYDANQNAVLPLTLVDKKISADGIPETLKMSFHVPENTLTEIGILKSAGSKWSLRRISDGEGWKLTGIKTANNIMLTGEKNLGYLWLFVISVGLLLILAFHVLRKGNSTRVSYYLFCAFFSATVVSFFLMLFYPGVLSTDTMDQWRQAQSGYYHNWHPIGLTLLIAFCRGMLHFCSANTQAAMVAWLTGVFFWVSCLFLVGSLIKNIKIGLFVTVLLIFYYPFWPYSVYMVMDVPFAASLLCFTALIINILFQEKQSIGLRHFALLVMVILIMLLNRPTAWAILLACLPGVALVMRKGKRLRSTVVFLAALAVALVTNKLVNKVADVHSRGNLINMNLAFELAGTLHFANAAEDELAHLKTTELVGMNNMLAAVNRYQPGSNVDYLYFGDNAPLPYETLLSSNTIMYDLPSVILRHPLALLQHKFGVHKVLWDRTAGGGIWFAYDTITNTGQTRDIYGLAIHDNSKMPEMAGAIRHWLDQCTKPGSIWQLFLRHIVIFIIMLCSIAISFVAARLGKGNDEFNRALAFLAWIAFACWLPYAIVLPGPSWRYMLPTTSIGVIVIACTIGHFAFCEISGREKFAREKQVN